MEHVEAEISMLFIQATPRHDLICYCGDDDMDLERKSDCEVCFTGENFMCGGVPYRTSVYAIGHLPSLNKSYSEVFHCKIGSTAMDGTCTSLRCKLGWMGTKCNQRDCMYFNGYCGEHNCVDITIGNQNISECVCKTGFQSVTIYDECTDKNEGQNNPCTKKSVTCVNSTSCEKLLHYTCSPEGANAVIILGVFLALLSCVVIIFTVVMFFCRKKLKDTESKLENLQKTIKDKKMKSTSSSNQSSNEENINYTKLNLNKIYEN